MQPQLPISLHQALKAKRESFDRLPIIDLAPLVDGSDPQAVAATMRWALFNTGFFYVKNHSIASELITGAFDRTRAFFDLPEADKMALAIVKSGPALRGYTPPFGENTDPENSKDLKECFDLGPENAPTRPFFGPNQWPAEALVPGFRETLYAYHEEMKRLSRLLLSGVALSLELPQGYFDAKMLDPISIQRLLYYPPQTGQIDPRIIGIGAHSDYGNLTILAQDAVGGLQVMNRERQWIEAQPIPSTFVVNIGDLLQRLTNDLYQATLHRVVNTSGRARYSLPFFVEADHDAVFEPLLSCVSDDRPARYAPVTCGDYMYSRYWASFPHLQETKAA
jgi:isopenicillin N synthase-like dioxygenase